jgi:flagellar hook assembly protein FlgD
VSSAARIEFAQPVAGEVSAHIFDVEGRIVRTLAERVWTPAGTGGFTLDARDARGAPLRNGIYFVSLESSAGRRTSRFVVAR